MKKEDLLDETRFLVILDYCEFKVVQDVFTDKYYYIPYDKCEDFCEVEVVAILDYNIDHDLKKDGAEMSELFDNDVCGEMVTDDGIQYLWFKKKVKDSNVELYRKMEQELEAYRKELLNLPPEEILTHSYAYTIKQDILFALLDCSLPDEQARALLKQEFPLETVFETWEHHEGSYMEEIRSTINCAAADAPKE